MKKITVFIILFILSLAFNCFGGGKMLLKSKSFKEGGDIPKKYVMKTIGGENISPQFEWENAPQNTKSFALIMVDPHPIARNWVHWAVIDIPPDMHSMEEGWSLPGKSTTRELINSYGFRGYGGPQPPKNTGKHPNVTTVYALDCAKLKIKDNPSYEELIRAIEPHILDKAEYTGYFEQK